MIGLDRIEALILQRIGAHFVGQPDAAPLLVEVKQNAGAFLTHQSQRGLQLRSAIAFQAAQHIAGKTGRVQPRQDRRVARRIADLDGVMFLAAIIGAKDVQA